MLQQATDVVKCFRENVLSEAIFLVLRAKVRRQACKQVHVLGKIRRNIGLHHLKHTVLPLPPFRVVPGKSNYRANARFREDLVFNLNLVPL